FEQIYGAPFLARLLFAEIGLTAADDLILRLEYDGAITQKKSGKTDFAVLGATKQSAKHMEQFLEREHQEDTNLEDALNLAFDTWAAGQKIAEDSTTVPTREEIRSQRSERIGDGAI